MVSQKKKLTIRQLEILTAKSKKQADKWAIHTAYLIDFKTKYIQALADGKPLPRSPKNSPK